MFGNAFNAATKCTWERVDDPLFRILRHTPLRALLPYERALRDSLRVLDRYAYDLIASRRCDPTVANRKDLLSRYIALGTDETTGEPFSDQYLRDIVLNIMCVRCYHRTYACSIRREAETLSADALFRVLEKCYLSLC